MVAAFLFVVTLALPISINFLSDCSVILGWLCLLLPECIRSAKTMVRYVLVFWFIVYSWLAKLLILNAIEFRVSIYFSSTDEVNWRLLWVSWAPLFIPAFSLIVDLRTFIFIFCFLFSSYLLAMLWRSSPTPAWWSRLQELQCGGSALIIPLTSMTIRGSVGGSSISSAEWVGNVVFVGTLQMPGQDSMRYD